MHIHKWGKWEDKILTKESYLPGFFNKEQVFLQIKKCIVCGKAKQHKP